MEYGNVFARVPRLSGGKGVPVAEQLQVAGFRDTVNATGVVTHLLHLGSSTTCMPRQICGDTVTASLL